MRSKTKVKNLIGPLLKDNVELVSYDQEMAEMLNTYFATVFTREDCDHLPRVKNVFCADKSQSLSSFMIGSNAVKDKLCKLKNNKAPGIDSVGSKMLIEIADEISVFLAELYNKSWKTGDVPEE